MAARIFHLMQHCKPAMQVSAAHARIALARRLRATDLPTRPAGKLQPCWVLHQMKFRLDGEEGDVDVVEVRGGAARGRVVAGVPGGRGDAEVDDLAGEDDVLDAQGGGVASGPAGDLPAERAVAGDHDVDRVG